VPTTSLVGQTRRLAESPVWHPAARDCKR